ncbi:hypothetical protein K440DRAFT_160509 [Wilcoxina mikolae CBS 423.85]|nr:hypothetical protein K440DRAFT_160509 [Wilcoxina mikolae CBS 423.85]
MSVRIERSKASAFARTALAGWCRDETELKVTTCITLLRFGAVQEKAPFYPSILNQQRARRNGILRTRYHQLLIIITNITRLPFLYLLISATHASAAPAAAAGIPTPHLFLPFPPNTPARPHTI